MNDQTVMIIGTGIAGYSVAREFRRLDKTTPVLMISHDGGESYPKPMLSNAFAKGKTAADIVLADAQKMAANLNVEIIVRQQVRQIDPEQKMLTLDNGDSYAFAKLVLAVGGVPNRLRLAGDGVQDALAVNNLDDYRNFRSQLQSGRRHVAIIGPGLIGCEFANDLTMAEHQVSVIGPDAYPISALLPEAIGQALQQHLSRLGVEWYLGTAAEQVNRIGKQAQIVLQDGSTIEADIVLAAIGLHANTKLALDAGLAVNRGIVTDQFLQTSQPDIYAIGDCAEVAGRYLPFIQPVMIAAKSLAKTLAGEPAAVVYPPMPVAIKTPAYPLLVLPPKPDTAGEWLFEPADSGFGCRGLFQTTAGALSGFVLSGDCVGEKQKWLAEIQT